MSIETRHVSAAPIIALVAATLALGGCSALNTVLGKISAKRREDREAAAKKDNARRYAADIETLAAEPLDRDGLASNALDRTRQLLGRMDEKLRHIDVGVAEAEAAPLRARLLAIKRHHAAEAAALVPDPEAALRLLGPHFPTPSDPSSADAEMLAVARAGASARTEARTAMFREHHSYAWRGGQRSDCVFASKAFGAEGLENPGLASAFSGTDTIHVRCYLPQTVGTYRKRPSGHFIVEWTGGQEGIAALESRPAGDRHLDFVLDATHLIDRRLLAAEVLVRVDFSAMEDNKVVVEDGAVRVRPDAIVEEVTGGTFFWER